jgi:hypothetical protein
MSFSYSRLGLIPDKRCPTLPRNDGLAFNDAFKGQQQGRSPRGLHKTEIESIGFTEMVPLTSGGRSVGLVRLRTKTTEFVFGSAQYSDIYQTGEVSKLGLTDRVVYQRHVG